MDGLGVGLIAWGLLAIAYVGINGWATTGGLIAAAAAVAWTYVQGWF